MRARTAAIVLVVSVALGSGQALAQPVTEEFRLLAYVDAILWNLAAALPAPGGVLHPRIVTSPRDAVGVSGEEVTVTTGFLSQASRNALAAIVAYQLVPDPVYFAITMDRAGFDGPSGLVELNGRLLYDIDIEAGHQAAVNAAYVDMVETIRQNSFWAFAHEGYHLMYRRVIDGATGRYDQALAAYKVYLRRRPPVSEVAPITAEFIQVASEVTAVLRDGDPAGVSPWRPRIVGALRAYPPRGEE